MNCRERICEGGVFCAFAAPSSVTRQKSCQSNYHCTQYNRNVKSDLYRFPGHPRWISFCFSGSRGCAAATGIGESSRTLCSLFRYVFHRRRPFPGASGFILEKRIPTRHGSSENWGFVGPTVQHRRGRVSRPSEFTDLYGGGTGNPSPTTPLRSARQIPISLFLCKTNGYFKSKTCRNSASDRF